jgi:transposase
MERKKYPGELTDKEWDLIQHIVEKTSSPRGRKPKYGKRKMLDAVFYLLRSGCSWRLLPHDFPPWQAVYAQFRRWKAEGLFEQLHSHVRGSLRIMMGRAATASAGIIDSQSVKTTEKGGSAGMTQEKRLKEENGTLQSTRKASSYRRMLRARPKVTSKDAESC